MFRRKFVENKKLEMAVFKFILCEQIIWKSVRIKLVYKRVDFHLCISFLKQLAL